MSDEDERRQLNSNAISQHEVDIRRRLSDIKTELQGLMRQKKKYDEEKLKQDAEFFQSEINDLRNSIVLINREINNQTQTKKRLHVQMTNLRSRSRLRYTNLTVALRDKRGYEAELKKENKTEEYRDLARREIRSIEAALPILREEDEYKAHLKVAEDAQQAATIKRKNLEDGLNKNLRKQADIKQLLSENAEKLPQIEATIDSLRLEREQLLASTAPSSANGRKARRRVSLLQQQFIDSPQTDIQTPVQSFGSLEDDCLDHEKHQYEDQLNKVDSLINYFREKLTDHGLTHDQTPSIAAPELLSPLYHPITADEEQTILSSYMEDREDDKHVIAKSKTTEPTTTIAMKLPRNFAPLNLNGNPTNEIIHSPYYEGHEIEYKKELSSDILNKYGGQTKKNKQQSSLTGRKHKKNKKNFAITHNPQMIALYNSIRSSTGSSDTLPSMPMYEYDLSPSIQSLEYFKQSLLSYINELSYRSDEQQSKSEDDDIRDSALDTFSETSDLIEPMINSTVQTQSMNILETRSSASSDEKKTLTSSPPPSINLLETKKNQKLPAMKDLTAHFIPLSLSNIPQIGRQESDEGYRSVRNDYQLQVTSSTSYHNSPLLTRSKSYDSTTKVNQWLSSATSLPSLGSISTSSNHDFQATEVDNEE